MLKWGRFPICPEMSRLSPFVLFCPSWGLEQGQIGTKEDKRDKRGHFGTNWEMPPFSIYPPQVFLIRDVPTQIAGHPGHFQSKTTQKGAFHKVFVLDILTYGSLNQ